MITLLFSLHDGLKVLPATFLVFVTLMLLTVPVLGLKKMYSYIRMASSRLGFLTDFLVSRPVLW